MKIGIDARLWSESGVGRYVRNLVMQIQILDKKNDYVLFCLSKDKQEILKQVQNDNFRILEANIRWHTVEEQLRFPQILKKENLDLVHFSYFSVPVLYNKPFIVTIHDLILDHFPTGQASTLPLPIYGLKRLGYQFIVRQAAKKAKKIITVSNATKKEIVDHLKVDEDKVIVTYEGVEKKISNIKYQINLKILNTKYFLYVGNAYPHKNLERLLKAFKYFCHPERSEGSRFFAKSDLAQNDVCLILVGKEDYFYKRLKKKVISMGFEKNVLFYGEISDEELGDLYKNAMALIMPSLMEGFGLPALEAMANKCLVLASDIPPLHEVCSEAAVYFDPYNIQDINDKMHLVCSKSLKNLLKKKEAGLERVKMFSWNKMAKETLGIYESSISL